MASCFQCCQAKPDDEQEGSKGRGIRKDATDLLSLQQLGTEGSSRQSTYGTKGDLEFTASADFSGERGTTTQGIVSFIFE